MSQLPDTRESLASGLKAALDAITAVSTATLAEVRALRAETGETSRQLGIAQNELQHVKADLAKADAKVDALELRVRPLEATRAQALLLGALAGAALGLAARFIH